MILTKIFITNCSENYENFHSGFSEKFRWWKIRAKSLENSKFWIIKFSSFKISNSDSVGVNPSGYNLFDSVIRKIFFFNFQYNIEILACKSVCSRISDSPCFRQLTSKETTVSNIFSYCSSSNSGTGFERKQKNQN